MAAVNIFILGTVLMVATCAANPETGPPATTYTAEQIRAGLLATAEKIKSLSVVYESNDYDVRYFPLGSYLHRDVTVKSPCSLRHVSAHGTARLDWQDDPLQQRAYVTEDHAYNEYPVNRRYSDSERSVKPTDPLPGTLAQEFYFMATGIWPLERRAALRPLGGPYMLREVAKGKEFSAVRPRQEMVDRRWCHVLEWPGKERLWLDAERGFILLRRETNAEGRPVLAQRIELGGHTEAAPGIWLPGWLHSSQFDYDAPTEEGRLRTVVDARHKVLRAEVNRVDDGAFVFQPRPGSLVDKPGSKAPVQAQAGGLDHLDELVRWLRKYQPSTWPQPPSGIPISSVLFLPTAGFIAACEVRRRAARRRVASEARL